MTFHRMTLKRTLLQDRGQVMSLFASSIKLKPKYIFAVEWGYLVLWRPQFILINYLLFWASSAPSPIKLAWNNLYLMLSCSSSVYRRTHFYCTSTNHTGSTHRVQKNWAVAGFEEDCVGKRFCNFWQSRRGKLHVFCTFRTAWPHQRNQNLPWWVTPNYCATPSGKP